MKLSDVIFEIEKLKRRYSQDQVQVLNKLEDILFDKAAEEVEVRLTEKEIEKIGDEND